MTAPVCHISPSQSIEDKRRAQQQIQQVDGGTPKLPTIPVALNLPTAIAAIKKITQIINMLTGASDNVGLGNFNTRGDSGAAGTNGKAGQAGKEAGDKEPKNKKSRWVECNRTTEKVRVYQEDAATGERNEDNYVDIERINLLVMQDTVTGSLWTWKR